MGKSARSNRKKRIRLLCPLCLTLLSKTFKKIKHPPFLQCPILSCFFMKNTTASISADFWRPHPPSKIWGEAVSLVKGIWGPPLIKPKRTMDLLFSKQALLPSIPNKGLRTYQWEKQLNPTLLPGSWLRSSQIR